MRRYTNLFIVAFVLISMLVTAVVPALSVSASPLLAPSITPTMTDTIINDGVGGDPADGKADPGETIEYTATIPNLGTDATVVTFNDIIDLKTTLVAGSLNISPLAVDDTYDTIGNTLLEVGVTASGNPAVTLAGSLFDNDTEFLGDTFTLKSVEAANFSAISVTTATESGGSVTVEGDGNFSYIPPVGFSGTDHFDYILTDDGPDNILGNADDLTGAGRVTINVKPQRVWYVKNNTAAGGLGRSSDPFDTLTEAQTASSTNDTIYVFQGDGTTTGQNTGIALKNGQRLLGEGVALTVQIPSGSFNSIPSPTTVTLRAAGSMPLIDSTGGPGIGVQVTDISNVEIRGLNIAGNVNAVNVTTTAANSGSFELANNIIRGAVQNGIDINGGGSGTLTVSLHNNTITSGLNSIDIQRTTGNINIIAFNDNVVTGNTLLGGINIVGPNVTFDATPGGTFQTVSGGVTTIGQSGNGIGGTGIILTNVAGDLSFTDLDIFTEVGAGGGLIASGTATYTGSAGFRVAVGAGVATIDARGGPAVSINTATISLPFLDVDSTLSSTSGVSLVSVLGSFSAGSGSIIASAIGTDFNIDGSNATMTYDGTIIDVNGGRVVSISNTTGGTKSFTGSINDTGSSTGISLTNNSGATISFSGGLLLSTGANAAFTATGGGTVNVCDENPCNPAATGALVNTLTTTTGTALNVANTTIGANKLEFRSITSNGSGSANGIVLDNAGTGGLTVSGNGGTCTSAATCTGGTISNKTGADGTGNGIGIYVNNTSNVSITRMQLNDFTNYAIRGTTVTNFTLNNSHISGTNGDNAGVDEGSIIFDGLLGTSSFSTDSIAGSVEDNFRVRNSSGTATDIVITGSTFLNAPNDNLIIEPSGTAIVTTHITNNTFTGAGGDHIQTATTNSATLNVVVTGNLYSNGFAGSLLGGITISGGNLGSTEHVNFNISNNGTSGAPLVGNVQGGAININQGNGGGTWQGQVSNNFIGNAVVLDSGSAQASGIRVENHSVNGTMTAIITNNTIRQWHSGPAINTQAGDAGNASNAGTINLTVTNNLVANPVAASSQHGFVANIGAGSASDASIACVDVRSNTLDGNAITGGSGIRIRQRGVSTVKIRGYTGAQYDTAAVIAYETTQNAASTPAPTATTTSTGSGFGNTAGGSPCPQPVVVAMVPNSNQILAQVQPDTSLLIHAYVPSAVSASATADAFTQTAWVKPQEVMANTSVNFGGDKPLFLIKQPAPALSGETVGPITIGNLPASKSVTI